jgi:hypothetical protein
VKVAGVLGLVGAILTLGAGVYLVLIAGVVSGFASALPLVLGEPYGIPSIAAGVAIVASAAVAIPFATLLIVGRGPRPSGFILALAGVVAGGAQAAWASSLNGGERALFTLVQPSALVVASGLVALARFTKRRMLHSA